jgi:hypothetical protein
MSVKQNLTLMMLFHVQLKTLQLENLKEEIYLKRNDFLCEYTQGKKICNWKF